MHGVESPAKRQRIDSSASSQAMHHSSVHHHASSASSDFTKVVKLDLDAIDVIELDGGGGGGATVHID